MLQLQLGLKGELIIPKKIREQLGLIRERQILIEIKDKSLEIKSVDSKNVVKKWEERAKKCAVDVSKWKYGDELYEEVF